MTCILETISRMCPEIEGQLKPSLQGLTGLVVRSQLPQTWVLATESDMVTLNVDSNGNVRAFAGYAPQPDVTIKTSHALLSAALTTRTRASIPAGPFHVEYHTPKGKRAFEFLRGRLGL